MLANGATLGYRKHTAGENSAAYTDLPGLKEIPEVGVELDKEENTCLTDPHKMYEEGIGDLPASYTTGVFHTGPCGPVRLCGISSHF